MSIPMLKQLCLCVSEDGTIGFDGKLLSQSWWDFQEFAKITSHTALIAGTKTAIEMIQANAQIGPHRPLIVVTSDPGNFLLAIPNARRHIYFVPDLISAYAQVENLMLSQPLLRGWTVCGGAKLFEECLDSRSHINRAYVAVINKEVVSDPLALRLKYDANGVIERVQSKMANWVRRSIKAQVVGKLASDPSAKTVSLTKHHLIDNRDFDDREVALNGDLLSIEVEGSESMSMFRMCQLAAFHRHPGRNAIEIRTITGDSFDVRLTNRFSLNYLELLLLQYLATPQ